MFLPRKSKTQSWASFIFNLISPLYYRIDFIHSSNYNKAIEFVHLSINIRDKKVLDVGTGTGDWGAMFQLWGATEIHGIDFASRMIHAGKKKNPSLLLSLGNAENISQFEDNSFDVVTASFVVHGVKSDRRKKIISEMKRVSRNHIVLHDFVGKSPLVIRFLEFFERSDYKNFKKHIVIELQEQFSNVETKYIHKGVGIYIAQK